MAWHTARDDALAAAMLLSHFLRAFPGAVRLTEDHLQAAAWAWPALSCGVADPVQRTRLGVVEPHLLARLVDRIPRTGEASTDAEPAWVGEAIGFSHRGNAARVGPARGRST
jgi:DNA polymerase-3 subunit epsilon